MARTFLIKKGATEISIINTGATGWIGLRGELGSASFALDVSEGDKIPEIWRLTLKQTTHDNVAANVQAFIKILREAYQYHKELWQGEPVYIVQQATNESGARYALIHSAPSLEWPDLFDLPFEVNTDLEYLDITILREHPWRSGAPDAIGSAITLGESDGPADPTRVHVANFRDDVNITHFKEYDGGAYTDLVAGDRLFPATVAHNDEIMIGSTDQPLKHIVFPNLGTAGDFTTSTWSLSYWNGSGTALVLGTDYTCYPGPTLQDCFAQTDEDIIINVKPPSDFIKRSLDSVNAFWYEIIETNAAPVYATNPVQHATEAIYAQSHPYVEVPAAALKGDSRPTLLWRVRTPAGGDENPGFSTLSRILACTISSGLTKFTPFLNAGGDDNPGDWTTTQKTDATATADPEAPGGKHSAVNYSGDSTMQPRVEFSGDDILDSWAPGEYLVMVRLQQIGGSAGDQSVKLRTFIGSTDVFAPQADTPEVDLAGVDQGPETIDLGLISIPFTRAYSADSLAATDLIFQIHTERSTGSSTLVIYDLILFPVHEGSVGPDHNADGDTAGSGGLRGANVLDIDSGVIDWRCLKYIKVGANLIPAENWVVMQEPPKFEKLATKTRIYFLLLHYPSGGAFGTGPLIASFGCGISVEIYAHYRFGLLRGAG